MSNLVLIDANDRAGGRQGAFAPERILDGEPSFKVWERENLGEGRVRSGVWEATPGVFRNVMGDKWEYCTILSGVVELTEEGQDTRRLTAGDTFVMRPGFVGEWRTIETVRKLWVVVNDQA